METVDDDAGPPIAEAAAAGAAEPRPGDLVGRYTIERVLGAGGMGVVYAAHDPDLDRRIALKILRTAAGKDHTQARARLLREARAMAKLSHPNVITVHEVGTDGHRDFVAMELIDGKNVADWLLAPRPPAEVLRVMLAAGRGLAAAHAAGLVHRDFKPHNVLLGPGGRVVVTDFGLARAFEGEAAAATRADAPAPAATGLEETLDAPAATPRGDASSLSSTLTQTGAMLGTPAYMAPEQFAGGATGPETDQFSFCVALWEGLARSRPFRGGSIDELRRAVEGGAAAGGGAIPRRLRRILERGFRRDPAARWPSMTALLAAIERAERRPRVIAASLAAVAAAGAAGGIYLMSRPDPAVAAPACEAADARLAAAWSPETIAGLDARFADDAGWRRTRDGLASFADDWKTTWQTACARAREPRFGARVACLEGALDELGAVASVLASTPLEALRDVDIPRLLQPPAGCLDATRTGYPAPPLDPALRARVDRIRRDLAVARTLARAGRREDAIATATAATASARAVSVDYPAILAEALQAQATVEHVVGSDEEAEKLYAEAARVAERAGHDPVRAMALLGSLELLADRSSDGMRVRAAAEDARAAVVRAGNDPALRASIDLSLADLAWREGDLDRAVTLVEGARRVFEQRADERRSALAAGREATYRLSRRGPGDRLRALALLEQEYASSLQVVGPTHPRTRGLREAIADTNWQLGRLAEAHAIYDVLETQRPAREPDRPLVRRRGRVVDGAGRPVAGAAVHAGGLLIGDSERFVMPLLGEIHLATATTGADGRFTIEVEEDAAAVAQAPGGRAAPVALGGREATLVIGGVGAIDARTTLVNRTPEGDDRTLALARHAYLLAGSAAIAVGEAAFAISSPVADDGAWHLAGLPAGRYDTGVLAITGLGSMHRRARAIDVAPGAVVDVELPVELGEIVIDVIVRSESAGGIPSAEVHVVPGRLRATNARELGEGVQAIGHDDIAAAQPVDERTATTAGAPLYQDDDIHARVGGVAPGERTICVVPLAFDLRESAWLRLLRGAQDDLLVTCKTVQVAGSPPVQAFVIDVPPPRRLHKQ